MRKKIFSIILCSMLFVGLVGCGKGNDESAGGGTGNGSETAGGEVDVADATELLTKVWDTYEEAELFPVGGGDFDNVVADAPGKYDVSKTVDMDSVLGLPESSAGLIDDAASMMHMMNANTFTAGAFHLKDAGEQQALADALKDNIMNRQWICGFPDTLIIVSVGNEYLVSAFGNAEIIETFKTKLLSQYEMAQVVYEESLVQ